MVNLMTKQDIVKLQKQLSELIGVSGNEEDVSYFIKEIISPLVDKVWIDGLGNLLAIKEGTNPEAHKIMLDAHMDEVGLIINHVEEDGFLLFGLVGGFDKRILLAQAVILKASDGKRIHGVIGAKPPHLLSADDLKKPIEESELYIDAGFTTDQDAVNNGVNIGTTGVLHDPFVELPNNSIRGRAIDDRLGCNVIIQLLQRLKDQQLEETLLLSFSVQEEVGGRGAGPSAFTLDPTMALAIESTTGDNNPHIKPKERPAEFGKGPSITIMDSSTIASHKINQRLVKNAKLKNLSYQFKKPRIGGGTNAGKIHLTKSGIPSGIVSVPCKYLHSPITYANIDDALGAVDLLEAFLKNDAKITV